MISGSRAAKVLAHVEEKNPDAQIKRVRPHRRFWGASLVRRL
jgi:hypothetical protein